MTINRKIFKNLLVMKIKSILTILLLTITTVIFAQSNQLDGDGRKNGKWIVYLDKNWKNIDDSTKAIYYRYTYYASGTNLYPMGKWGKKKFKLEGDTTSKLLNGEYKWYDNDGKLSSVHVFKNGEYISWKEYYKNGNLSQHVDYTKKGDCQEHGWTFYNYDKEGKLKYTFIFGKDPNGRWPKTRG